MKELDIKKYAVLFLGLLVTDAAFAYCYTADSRPECKAAEEQLDAEQAAHQREISREDAEALSGRTIQVITPDSSYLAYPSAYGRTVSVYGGLG
jgi:hypothetical protein